MSEVVVATVESIVGTVIARDEDGNTRVLQPGDQIFHGEEVIAEDGAFIEMAFEDGSTMTLAGNESATITPDLAESAEPEPQDAEVADATVEEIIAALDRGEDITDLIEAPAAGLDGGVAGEGGSFVRIARGSEEVGEVTYAYDSNALRGAGEGPDGGAILAAADTAAVDEPTVDDPEQDEPVEDEPVEDEPVEDEPVEDEPVEDEPEEVAAPSITLTAGDDLLEGNAEAGNEVATITESSDPLGAGLDYAFTGNSNEAGFYAIDPATGTVTLTEAGADHVNVGNELPTIEVTASDGDGRTASDTATIGTVGGPSITLTAGDDLLEGNAEAGNEVATITESSDPLGAGLDYAFTGNSNEAGFYAIDPATGTVTLTEAGADHVNGGNELPQIEVTASDGDGRTASDTATIEVIPAPSIQGLVGAGGDAIVYEAFLEGGTGVVDDAPDDAGTTSGGSFTITAVSGLASLTFAGGDADAGTDFNELFDIDALNGASESDPLTIDTTKGVLSITSFTDDGDGTYTVNYSYELTEAADHPDEGRDKLEKDAITVTVLDDDDRTVENSIDVTIVDDMPVDDSRVVTFENTGEAVFQGAAVQMGADQDGAELKWTKAPEGLSSGGVSLHYEGVDSSVLKGFAGEDGDLVFTLTGHPDGSYTFEQVGPIDLTTSVDRDISEGNFENASGPKDFFYVTDSGEFSTDLGSDSWAIRISGTSEANGAQANRLNSNANEFGVSTPEYSVNDSVTFDLDDTAESGDPNLFSSLEIRFSGTTEVEYTVIYTNGEQKSGTSENVEFVNFEAPEGEFLSKVTIKNVGTDTAINGIGTTELVSVTEEGVPFDVGFTAVDGDNDDLDGTLQFFAEPGQVLDQSDSEESVILVGSSEDNTLLGGDGDDILIGGAGDDILTGGAGDDIFRWNARDEGTEGDPANDVITDFGNGNNVLDLKDLLQGENEGNIAEYINAEQDGVDTVLYISSTGDLDVDNSNANANQTIRLEGKSFSDFGGATTSQEVINHLLSNDQLKIDQ
ncbi:retention module-containing protein [Thioalkalivibrio sp. AKL19]|uniref:retention module-containing protein n=1 Tax=Thioalkalivibrio sp. AKL19 TaxID=1266914 RepID=UPI00040BC0FF|nr:retention module-containing protein [Thioalkalivibrio sp. AKL19]